MAEYADGTHDQIAHFTRLGLIDREPPVAPPLFQPSGVLHRRFYLRFAKVLPRIVLIVSAAAQTKILNRVLTTHRPRLHMVEL